MKTEQNPHKLIMVRAEQDKLLTLFAKEIINKNKSRPDIANMHLSEMRHKINSAKIKNNNPIQRTRDSLAAMVGVTSQIKKAAGLV
ncbi:hypothetical protein [Thalassotalea profundi]|uniref:Uncharacterized protein n=1 Tax=Thalassotalea profundi TaxID=2036687 RepID=A0ABQ3IKU1_9GAMM|nr:hypothetical protein [Thalassotalea profundi]GHE87389.1 hypothetical protein GCM10011501_16050 [Thalassotalea profundi]